MREMLLASHLSPKRHVRVDVFPEIPAACKGCVWLLTAGVKVMCPFARCVRREGWVADQT